MCVKANTCFKLLNVET
nr:unnamed protein product [Callosobruchus chinensis]